MTDFNKNQRIEGNSRFLAEGTGDGKLPKEEIAQLESQIQDLVVGTDRDDRFMIVVKL